MARGRGLIPQTDWSVGREQTASPIGKIEFVKPKVGEFPKVNSGAVRDYSRQNVVPQYWNTGKKDKDKDRDKDRDKDKDKDEGDTTPDEGDTTPSVTPPAGGTLPGGGGNTVPGSVSISAPSMAQYIPSVAASATRASKAAATASAVRLNAQEATAPLDFAGRVLSNPLPRTKDLPTPPLANSETLKVNKRRKDQGMAQLKPVPKPKKTTLQRNKKAFEQVWGAGNA